MALFLSRSHSLSTIRSKLLLYPLRDKICGVSEPAGRDVVAGDRLDTREPLQPTGRAVSLEARRQSEIGRRIDDVIGIHWTSLRPDDALLGRRRCHRRRTRCRRRILTCNIVDLWIARSITGLQLQRENFLTMFTKIKI